jgi:amidase
MKMSRIASFVCAAVLAASSVHAASVGDAGASAGAGRTFDLPTATLADINAAMDAGALSSEKLVGLYLKRIGGV